MPSTENARINWEKMGLRWNDFCPHLMGAKATARAHRAYEKAKRLLLRDYAKHLKPIPFYNERRPA